MYMCVCVCVWSSVVWGPVLAGVQVQRSRPRNSHQRGFVPFIVRRSGQRRSRRREAVRRPPMQEAADPATAIKDTGALSHVPRRSIADRAGKTRRPSAIYHHRRTGAQHATPRQALSSVHGMVERPGLSHVRHVPVDRALHAHPSI